MNFLAHLYLSGNSEKLLIGNFIADSVKGAAHKNYPSEIAKGILLHREIDSYTDSHPIVEESKKRLRPNYRKYSGVIVDVLYDHFLATNWNMYSEKTLSEFSSNAHKLITLHQDILPEKSKLFFQHMIHNDILNAYAHLNSIDKVLQGMSRRTKFVSNMEFAIHDIRASYDLFEKEFKQFFPELIKHIDSLN